MESREIQSYCLDIMKAFDSFAKENHLTYWMSGGTLLGAVRHKGFIPWDDDVDLMMPRADYEYLIHHFTDKRYRLSSSEKDPEYHTPFARMWDSETLLEWNVLQEKSIGVFIDIFPMDGFPTNEIKSKLHMWHLKYYRVLINASVRKTFLKDEKWIIAKKMLKKLLRHNGNYYALKLNNIAKKYDYEKSAFVGVKTTSLHLFREKNTKEAFSSTIYLPFEDMSLPAPIGYDTYLSHLYGDYMQLPPEEERHSEHEFVIHKIRGG
jgi:lipopolysaccharide cholinephosphotransferase